MWRQHLAQHAQSGRELLRGAEAPARFGGDPQRLREYPAEPALAELLGQIPPGGVVERSVVDHRQPVANLFKVLQELHELTPVEVIQPAHPDGGDQLVHSGRQPGQSEPGW